MRRTSIKIIILTALITTFIAVSLSYFAFSEKNQYEFFNKGKIVCFTKVGRCFLLLSIK